MATYFNLPASPAVKSYLGHHRSIVMKMETGVMKLPSAKVQQTERKKREGKGKTEKHTYMHKTPSATINPLTTYWPPGYTITNRNQLETT